MSPGLSLDSLLFTALRAAAKAFPEILSVYNGPFSVDSKDDRSPITEADRRSNKIIAEELSRHSPYGIISEEGENTPFADRRSWEQFWLVDPLDGTKEFVKRNGEFTINIAFVEGRIPVLGVVYAPVLDLLYFASDDIGSYRLEGFSDLAAEIPADLVGRATKLAPRAPLVLDEEKKHKKIMVVGSRSHSCRDFDDYVQELEQRYAEQIEITTIGSALKPCYVAEGKADIYPRFGPTMEWDTAAAHAVVRGVGKRMTAYDGGTELIYNKEVLVNPSFLVY
jgi:3'(2'), 5'-bisphosphate nucleotidase